MGSNFTVFESAISALAANSQALSVASHNIANVNTPGYSRQQIILGSRDAQVIGGIELGLGVNTIKVRQIYDKYAEIRLAEATGVHAEADTRAQQLLQIEKVFNEVGHDGLSKFMNEFFNAMNEVANDPTSLTARTNLLNRAKIVTDRFHSLYANLDQTRTLIDGDITTQVGEINTLAGEIVELNEKIQNAGGDALTLRDERTRKVKELSQYIDAKSIETSEGVFQVYVGGGLQLLTGQSQSKLSVQADTANGNHLDVMFAVGSGTPTDISARIQGGSLYALLGVRDTNVVSYQGQLNEFAYELTTQINTLHTAGYNLNGSTGIEFFDTLTQSAAGTDLATKLRKTDGTRLDIKSGDTVTIGGDLGGAFTSNFTVSATTTLSDIASTMQTVLRARGNGTEVVSVQANGSLRVTSGAGAITGLTLSIVGKSTFNTAYTFTTPIAGGGATGDSAALGVAKSGAASLIVLDSAVLDNPKAVSASDSAANIPGGNAAMLQIAALSGANISFTSGSSTFSSFFGSLLSNIGSDSKSSDNVAQFTKDLRQQAEIQREQISGVSIDEEQLNLIKYQAAFQAATRLVGLADDILKQLVNLV